MPTPPPIDIKTLWTFLSASGALGNIYNDFAYMLDGCTVYIYRSTPMNWIILCDDVINDEDIILHREECFGVASKENAKLIKKINRLLAKISAQDPNWLETLLKSGSN